MYSFLGSSNSVFVHVCMCAGVCIQDHDTIVHANWKFLTSGCCVCVCVCMLHVCGVCVCVCAHVCEHACVQNHDTCVCEL